MNSSGIGYWIMYAGIILESIFGFWLLDWLRISIVILLVGWLWSWKSNTWQPKRKIMLWPMGVFLAVNLLSVLVSGEYVKGLHELRGIIELFVVFFAVLNFLETERQIRNIINAMTVSTIAASIFGIYQHFTGVERIMGTVGHFNTYAPLMMFASIIHMNMLLQAKDWTSKIFYFLVFCLNIVSVLFTMTRGVWLALLIALIINAILYNWKSLIAVILVAVVICFVPGFSERAQSIMDSKNKSNHERICLWQSALNMAHDHPVLGVGLGNFRKEYDGTYKMKHAIEDDLEKAHNDYLHVLAETGIMGLMSFFALISAMLYYCWLSYRNTRRSYLSAIALSGFICFIGFLLQGVTDYNFGTYWIAKIAFLIVAISSSIRYIEY